PQAATARGTGFAMYTGVSSVAVACSWGALGLLAGLLVLVYLAMRARLARASERTAVERRDRFFAVAAQELDAPLVTLRGRMAGLDSWSATPDRVAGLVREIERVPAPIDERERAELDLAELVREIVAQPPFSDRGPSVILRASPTR